MDDKIDISIIKSELALFFFPLVSLFVVAFFRVETLREVAITVRSDN